METIATIEKMYKTACLGVQETLDTLQTNTGVKDTIALFWINQLISKSREIQKARISDNITRDVRLQDPKLKGKDRESVKAEIRQDIQRELMSWVIQQPAESFERLPPESRQIFFILYDCVLIHCSQRRETSYVQVTITMSCLRMMVWCPSHS